MTPTTDGPKKNGQATCRVHWDMLALLHNEPPKMATGSQRNNLTNLYFFVGVWKTPPENRHFEPKNWWFVDGFPLQRRDFQISMSAFGVVCFIDNLPKSMQTYLMKDKERLARLANDTYLIYHLKNWCFILTLVLSCVSYLVKHRDWKASKFQGRNTSNFQMLKKLQEGYNTPLEHTPTSLPWQTMKVIPL